MMQSGDTLTDDAGLTWTIEGKLGRGTWGETWRVRSGTEAAVLKVPLLTRHFPDADDPATLAATCTSIASAMREALVEARLPYLPALRATLTMPDGRQGLLLPAYGASLEDRLAAGGGLSEAIDLSVKVLHRLATVGHGGAVHGNLRPSNVFLAPDGRVVLTDPLLDVARGHREALARHCPGRASYLPPEAAFHPTSGWDCWAVCAILFRAASAGASADDPRRGPVVRIPDRGLDRVTLATLRDAAASRLRAENANPRFAGRATEKLGALLNRGLSGEAEPSPPYRFERTVDLRARLVEVDELIHPAVETVSRVLLGPEADDGVFEGGEEVTFSVNVGATQGVVGHEDLAVGVNLRDLDAPGDGRVRLSDSRFHVDRYPSGRWRFSFVLPDVAPGRYQLRVAFAVKGSESAPMVAEGSFEVRPRPGYVPPPPDTSAPPPPLRFPGAPATAAPAPEAPDDAPPPPRFAAPTADHEPDTLVTDDADEPPRPPRVAPPRPTRPVAAPVGPPTAAPVGPPAAPATEAAPAPPPVPQPTLDPPTVDATSWGPAASPAPTVEEVPPLPAIELPDPALQDYPFPGGAGSDLPGYDASRSGSGGPFGPLGDRLSELFRGDPVTMIMAAAFSGFTLLLLVLALMRSC